MSNRYLDIHTNSDIEYRPTQTPPKTTNFKIKLKIKISQQLTQPSESACVYVFHSVSLMTNRTDYEVIINIEKAHIRMENISMIPDCVVAKRILRFHAKNVIRENKGQNLLHQQREREGDMQGLCKLTEN